MNPLSMYLAWWWKVCRLEECRQGRLRYVWRVRQWAVGGRGGGGGRGEGGGLESAAGLISGFNPTPRQAKPLLSVTALSYLPFTYKHFPFT